jgi:hypothetical protein
VQTESRRADWAAFAAVAAAGLAFVLWRGRANSFFFDEWSWIELRRSGLHAVLSSYNQHLLAFSTAAFQLLFSTVGLAHYWPYRALAAVAHLACAAAAFAYLRRLIAFAALPVVAVVVFMGSGWEYIFEGINAGFTGAIGCGIASFLALDCGHGRGERLACALLVVGLVFSEFSLLFAAGVAVELCWRDRGLRRAWVWLAPVAVYLVWWLAYYQGGSPGPSVGGLPKFLVDLASAAAGGVFGLGLQPGRVALVALVALLGWRIYRRRALTPRLAALLVVLGTFWLVVAYGRERLGEPWASRYIYTGVVLILLVAVESFRGVVLGRRGLAAVTVLAAGALVGNVLAFNGGERYLSTGSQIVRAELGAVDIARGVAPPAMIVDPVYAPQIQVAAYFAAVAQLGSTNAMSTAELLRAPERERAAADAVLLRAGDLRVQSPAASSQPGANGGDRCSVIPAGRRARLALAAPGVVLVMSSGGGPPSLAASRFATSPQRLSLPSPATAAARAVTVAVAADGSRRPWRLQITASGTTGFCPLDPSP